MVIVAGYAGGAVGSELENTLPVVSPETAGFRPEGLDDVDRLMVGLSVSIEAETSSQWSEQPILLMSLACVHTHTNTHRRSTK